MLMGATGTVGSRLLQILTGKNLTIRAGTRNISKAGSDVSSVEWVEFDLERPETFPPSLAGISELFMISRPGDDEAAVTAAPLITAAEDAGIQHITYLSAMGAEQSPDFSSRKVELLLEESAVDYTFLRANFFMDIFTKSTLAAAIKDRSLISVPAADARLSFVAAQDIAAAAAEIISNPEKHCNKSYTLTGGTALSHYDIAATLSTALQRDITYTPLPEELLAEMLQRCNIPKPAVSRLSRMYHLVREGHCEPVIRDLSDLLERPPLTFDEFSLLDSTQLLLC